MMVFRKTASRQAQSWSPHPYPPKGVILCGQWMHQGQDPAWPVCGSGWPMLSAGPTALLSCFPDLLAEGQTSDPVVIQPPLLPKSPSPPVCQ